MSTRTYYSDLKCSVEKLCSDVLDQFESVFREFDSAQNGLNTVFEAFDRQGLGLTLKRAPHSEWAVIMKDPSQPGLFRYQIFTPLGFCEHFSFESIEHVILNAYKSGFQCIAPSETLDRLVVKSEWISAIAVGDVNGRSNSLWGRNQRPQSAEGNAKQIRRRI